MTRGGCDPLVGVHGACCPGTSRHARWCSATVISGGTTAPGPRSTGLLDRGARGRGPRGRPVGRYHRQSERKNHGKRRYPGLRRRMKVKGRKRHILTDTAACWSRSWSTAPRSRTATARRRCSPPSPATFPACATSSPMRRLRPKGAKRIGRWSLEIVNRPAGVKGFQPRRWVVERSPVNRFRGDFETAIAPPRPGSSSPASSSSRAASQESTRFIESRSDRLSMQGRLPRSAGAEKSHVIHAFAHEMHAKPARANILQIARQSRPGRQARNNPRSKRSRRRHRPKAG